MSYFIFILKSTSYYEQIFEVWTQGIFDTTQKGTRYLWDSVVLSASQELSNHELRHITRL